MVEGPRKDRRAGKATRAWKRPSETSSTITWQQDVSINIILLTNDNMKRLLFCREHLEECADESDVLIGKDNHTQEGGESSMKDMGTCPEMHCIDMDLISSRQG